MTLIGFRRNIYLEWLEQAAALHGAGLGSVDVRERLDALVVQTVRSDVNRRQTLDILCNIWGPREEPSERLRREAVGIFQVTTDRDQHVALHYGLTILRYPFFREGARVIGQKLRFGEAVSTADVREPMLTSLGNLGAAADAVKRVTFSLRNWGILVDAGKNNTYRVREPRLRPGSPELERWLLAAALLAHPADELPFADLVGLPELFPFAFTVQARDLASEGSLLEVHRMGGGWEMVVLRV